MTQTALALNHPISRASPSSNDRNPRSRLLYQAVARISGLVRRRWANLVVDVLPGGNHRRERAGAYVANFGKVQPSSPSACRAAASRSASHSA